MSQRYPAMNTHEDCSCCLKAREVGMMYVGTRLKTNDLSTFHSNSGRHVQYPQSCKCQARTFHPHFRSFHTLRWTAHTKTPINSRVRLSNGLAMGQKEYSSPIGNRRNEQQLWFPKLYVLTHGHIDPRNEKTTKKKTTTAAGV